MKIPGGPTLISPWRLVNQHFIKKRVFWYITFISISHGWNDLWISHLSWHPRPPLFSEPQINSYLVEKTFVVLWKFWKSFRHCKSVFSSRLRRDWFAYLLTLFKIFIFCPKIQLWFPEKIVDFFWVKNSWKCCGFGLFSCWQLWFHEKNCQKNLVKNLWKCWGLVKIEFFGQKCDF